MVQKPKKLQLLGNVATSDEVYIGDNPPDTAKLWIDLNEEPTVLATLQAIQNEVTRAIQSIESSKEEQTKSLDITENGSYDIVPDSGKVLSKASVNVLVPEKYDEGYQSGYQQGLEDAEPNLAVLNATENKTYTPSNEVDGYSSVVVNVPLKYDDGYSVGKQDGYAEGYQQGVTDTEPNLVPLNVTENKEYIPDGDIDGYSSVKVNVPLRYDEGYNAGHEVGFTDGKEAGRQEGYNEGYQKGFEDNEPVVEPLEVTKNGTYTPSADVDGYNSVTVNVPIPDGYIVPNGTKEITENGTHDVTEYSSVNVNVVSGGGEENQIHATLDGTLTSIDSPVTKVISYACYGITTLETVNLPNATSFGGYSFRGCSGLKSINAPKVTSLGSYSFYGCSDLGEINFPLATTVPSTCFYQCSSLTKADFGVNCKSMAASSMAYCTKLNTLILRYTGGVVSTTTNSFSGVTSYRGYVYVPKALIEDYQATAEASTSSTNSWYLFKGRFRAIEDYPEITGGTI